MDSQLYIIIGIGLVIILLLVWIIRLEIMLKKLLGSKNGSIDDSISELRKNTETLRKDSDRAKERLDIVDQKLQKTISGNETIRFNPFKGDGSGSNQSFATALLNKDGDGVVISSIYSRDRMSVFSKPIKDMSSEYELTDEEKTVLKKAKESII
jgi:hypothetical protein